MEAYDPRPPRPTELRPAPVEGGRPPTGAAGISRRVVLDVLEAGFRRPWLTLLPLIVMVASGAATALDHDERYRSIATMSASDRSLLSDVTATNDTPFGFDTPAQRAVDQIGLLLGADPFVAAVAEQADVVLGEARGGTTLAALRASIGASVIGDSLVQVSATTNEPGLAKRLADATVSAYIDYVATATVEEGTSTEQSTEMLVREADAERLAAHDDVKAFLTDHPEAVGERASPVVVQDLRLRELEFERAEERYSAARAAQDQADAEAGTASDVVRQRLVLLIPAAAGEEPESFVREATLTMALFVVLGVMLSLAGAVAVAMLDRTVRYPTDISARFGVDVVAVIPDATR